MTSRVRSVALVLACSSSVGCYAYTMPVTDRPQPARVVELTLNDRGRVALADNIGAEVRSLEGQVIEATDSVVLLSVRRVISLNNRGNAWAGEHVTIRTEYVRTIRERQFSIGRTLLLGGIATAGATLLATGKLGGITGNGEPTQPGGGPIVD